MIGTIRLGRPASRVFALALAALLAALALALAGFAAKPAAAQNSAVSIVDFSFNPATLSVTAGSTVTWTNNGAAPHTATGTGGEFDTGTLQPGQSGSITFSNAGTYSYLCSIHPQMTGSISVTAGGTAQPTAVATTAPASTSNLPSTGAGAAVGGEASPALVAGLFVLAAMLATSGVVLRRRATV